MDVEQLLAELSKHPVNLVLEKLKKTQFYQPIFNDGHGVATLQFRDDLKTKDTEIANLTKARNDLQTEFETFKSKNPSAAELQRQYTDAIAAKDKEIQKLREDHAIEKKNARLDTMIAKFQSKLAEVIDPEVAEARAEKKRSRFQFLDDTTVQIMQAGQQIPFAGDMDAQIAALVEETVKEVPERLHRSDVVSGSGRETTAGGTGNGKKAFYDNIRKQVQPESPDKNQPSNQDRLNARLGHRAS